ncbi:conserved hypothetical protein [Talaromyces stipitatus ATCC 10500]|uniref:Glycoside hydrolase subgroup catalytic core protein n=1 Tax=Talaromyces stipitatus (strain ATCC 10500 / CBS 375.48 / QM 6759 / NRRL 1006) TaxID=441959 RepID=B8MIF6_TALSN|nr:uncharacterized protein TSTA_041180 [Talaromyces stipitatus ATCC 10500]EED14640.1 conserved hypothetical protein [Talaromyces stipitatus ATCC 10500]
MLVATITVFALLRVQGALAQASKTTNIPRWCGKPYKSGSPNINPGGQLTQPQPSPNPLLYVQIEPRHSIYVSSEESATFIVDAALSDYYGSPYSNSTQVLGSSTPEPFSDLYFSILAESIDQVLVTNSVRINTTNNLFDFNIAQLTPQFDPYDIVLYGASSDGNQTYSTATKLFYLPDKQPGSITKIDNLNGNLLYRNNATNNTFVPFFAFGFYTSWGGYLEPSLENLKAYYDLGYSAVHPIPSFSDNLTTVLDYMDELNLMFQYDMRGTYTNLTSVKEQVNLVKDYSSLLAWYTADEPDGNQDPLNATTLAYETIGQIDKYHPVGLVLNCQNYHFEEYSAGADYLMEDAYPIGINATWSKWGTLCNATYGDCGCDNCLGELQDVSNRIDDIAEYQEWLGQWSKPIWAVPQSFYGEGYWDRNPTAEETWVMNQLALNHGAKSIMLWAFPTVDELATANSQQSKVLTKSPVLEFVTGGQPTRLSVKAFESLDVSYWIVGQQALVSIVNLEYADASSAIKIVLPFPASSIVSSPWGNVPWELSEKTLNVQTLDALVTSLVILHL